MRKTITAKCSTYKRWYTECFIFSGLREQQNCDQQKEEKNYYLVTVHAANFS
jgi:hypothetical protein